MKELEEILATGPAAMNVSVEQLAKQVWSGCIHATVRSRIGLHLLFYEKFPRLRDLYLTPKLFF